jgi:hypothetical protein
MLFKILVAFVVLAGCCCCAGRIKRQEDGEFWWLKAAESDAEVEPIAEVKSNSPDEGKIANIKQGKNRNQMFKFTFSYISFYNQRVQLIRP